MKRGSERESETKRERGKEKRKISRVLGPAFLLPAQRSSSGGHRCMGLQFVPFYNLLVPPLGGHLNSLC